MQQVTGQLLLITMNMRKKGLLQKARGKHPGRPKVEIPKELATLYPKWKKGEIKAVEFM